MRKATSLRRVGLLSLLVLIALGSAALFISRPEHASGVSCGTGFSVLVNGSSGTTVPNVGGLSNVTLTIPTGNTQTIARVIFRASGKPIGRAQPGSGGTNWYMQWVTSLSNQGITHMDAEVYYTSATTPCTVNGYDINISNPTQTNLTATISPTNWEGPMSFSFPVNVSPSAQPSTIDITPFAIYSWTTTIGNINPSGRTAQFSSGQTVGNGVVSAKVVYGGKEFIAKLNVNVKSSDSPRPAPSNTSTGETSESGSETEENSTTQTPNLQNNPTAQNCIIAAIGKTRYDAINNGSVRPTLEEINKFNSCFANSNYILPSNFAPVAPTAIKELPKNTEIIINNPKNETKEDKEVLTLSGTAKPNSLVIIYVFSDPLVLTTTANESGEWTYVLEDPIEPGSHEIYSVVDRGDGVYERSDPFAFVIETAEAAESNPAGLSLRLADDPTPSQSKRSLILYAASTLVILMLVITGLILIIKRRSHDIKPQESLVTPQQDTVPEQPKDNTLPTGQA